MARTNKMGILKQKQQAAKMKKLSDGSSAGDTLEGQKRSFTNPKDRDYDFFRRGGKWICDVTSCREDPDGYRLVGRPNSGDVDHVFIGGESRGYRRYLKSSTRQVKPK